MKPTNFSELSINQSNLEPSSGVPSMENTKAKEEGTPPSDIPSSFPDNLLKPNHIPGKGEREEERSFEGIRKETMPL